MSCDASRIRRLWAAGGVVVLLAACSDAISPVRRQSTPRLYRETVPAAAVRLIGAGDIANCGTTYDSSTALLVSNYLTQWPDAGVYTLGDNAMPDGTAQDFTNCYEPTWGAFKAKTRPALGNHDYGLNNATGAFDYFGALLGPRDLGYYSYDAGAWHVVVLNSNTGYVPASLGSVQEYWLRNDLAANTKSCILAYWHHPRFYSTTSGTYGVSTRMYQVWIDLFNAGATLVLNGDSHQYERYAPQDPDGNPTPVGIREFIVGTGGDWGNAQPTILAPNSEVQKGSTYGVLELQLGDGWYSWNYMGIPGRTFTDSGTANCVNPNADYAPIARPGGPYSGSPGVAVAFDGSASADPDGDLPLTWAWDFGDGTNGSGSTPTHAYDAAGSYTVTLVVTDTTGASSTPATTTAVITIPNRPPVANPGGPYAGTEGTPVQFDGRSSTDPDSNALTYSWTFGDGTSSSGPAPQHSYADNGSYTVTLTVMDSLGARSSPVSTTAIIDDAAPVVDAGADGTAALRKNYSLRWSFTDAGARDAPWNYVIDWGDGAKTTGTTRRLATTLSDLHSYRVAGSYTITVTVTDKDGGSGSDTRTVVVR